MSAQAKIPHLLTEPEAAEIIGISPRTLRALRSEGKIRYVRPSPRKIYYREDDLAEYIAAAARIEEPPCPSTNPPKAVSGTTTSSTKASGILDRLAARPSGMPKGLRMINGGKRP